MGGESKANLSSIWGFLVDDVIIKQDVRQAFSRRRCHTQINLMSMTSFAKREVLISMESPNELRLYVLIHVQTTGP